MIDENSTGLDQGSVAMPASAQEEKHLPQSQVNKIVGGVKQESFQRI